MMIDGSMLSDEDLCRLDGSIVMTRLIKKNGMADSECNLYSREKKKKQFKKNNLN